jgi:hypothetical protein
MQLASRRTVKRAVPTHGGNFLVPRRLLAKKVGEAAQLVSAPHIEGRFPDRDLAAAHDPNLDTEPTHGESAVGILPFAVPYIGHCVIHQCAKLFL